MSLYPNRSPIINCKIPAWIAFILSTVLLFHVNNFIFDTGKQYYDKKVIIDKNITVDELYNYGYIVINKDKDGTYYVRELFDHEIPIEVIRH